MRHSHASSEGEDAQHLLSGHTDYDHVSTDENDDLELNELATTPGYRRGSSFLFATQKKIHNGRPVFARRQPLKAHIKRVFLGSAAFGFLTFVILAVVATVLPSYSNPPPRYHELRQRVVNAANRTGSANLEGQKIFIAASLYDARGELVGGDWGRGVLDLISILGPENVHLSIYENDPSDESELALGELEQQLKCNSSLMAEKLDVTELAHVSLPDGTRKVQRMDFLAAVRNRALAPLNDPDSTASRTQFDRLLYLNDVVFDPIDAANLLFSTGRDDQTGKTSYLAACAIDFINPVKFYDTFATKDSNGYTIGVPIYPWFSTAGDQQSRNAVLAQSDAVPVKSCWGGMVAFDARWFQPQSYGMDSSSPLRFRAENETFWEASECCLINADLSLLASDHLSEDESGIFMNPYVRVAYSKSVLGWLSFSRRFETLYSPVQAVLNWIAQLPHLNERRQHRPGEEVTDLVWEGGIGSASAAYHDVRRNASAGAFCGARQLSYLDEQDGKRLWRVLRPP